MRAFYRNDAPPGPAGRWLIEHLKGRHAARKSRVCLLGIRIVDVVKRHREPRPFQAPRILAGIVNVNSPTVNDEIHAPMGGVRDSGWGRTGPDSLKEFQDVIWINSHSGQRQYPI